MTTTLTLGRKVQWKSAGGIRQSTVQAYASNITDRSLVAAVDVRWGKMWISADLLTYVQE